MSSRRCSLPSVLRIGAVRFSQLVQVHLDFDTLALVKFSVVLHAATFHKNKTLINKRYKYLIFARSQ